MNKTAKTLAIIGVVLAGLGTTGFLVWQRVKKLVTFALRVKRVEILKASLTQFKMKLLFNFTNNSDLQIVLSKVEIEAYINGVYMTTLKEEKDQVIYAKSISVLDIDLDIDPKLVLQKLAHTNSEKLKFILNIKEQKMKLVTKLWIKFALFKLPITIPYEAKIKDWT
jgi:LEA14-like dessication related protein